VASSLVCSHGMIRTSTHSRNLRWKLTFWCPLAGVVWAFSLNFLFTAPAVAEEAREEGPLRILSSGTLDYDFDGNTVTSQGPIDAEYGPYRLKAGAFVWNRKTGVVEASGGVTLDNSGQSFDHVNREGRGDFFEAWWPRSYMDVPFVLKAGEAELGMTDRMIGASGGVSARFARGRLNASQLDVVATEDGKLSAKKVRMGSGVFLLSAESIDGNNEEVVFTDTTTVLGEPSDWGPRIHAREIRNKRGTEYISLYGVTLGVGPVPVIYLPRVWLRDWDIGVSFDLGAGFSDNLGIYGDAGISFKVAPFLLLNPAFSYYGRRGLLLSPNFSWERTSSSGEYYTKGSLLSGWISDQGSAELRGVDRFGNPIGTSRGYALAQGYGNQRGGWSFVNQFEARSDTEVLRDFRPELESRYFAPESFSELFVPFGPFSFSALGRFRTLDMTESIEAIPSLSVALDARRLGVTSLVQEGWVDYDRLRRADSSNNTLAEADRWEGAYRLSYLLPSANWISIEPTAGIRQRLYQNVEDSGEDGASTLFETGLDVSMAFNRKWETKSRIWDVDGLLHQTRPLVGYRWMPQVGMNEDEIPQIYPTAYTSGVDPLGFSNLTYRSDSGAEQIFRVGWENRILAGSYDDATRLRNLGSFSLYQDFIDARPGAESRSNNTMLSISGEPAPWIALELFSRVDTDSLTLIEFVPGLRLRDGDRWESRWYFQSLQHQVNQLLWDASVALNRKNRFLFEMRYNGQSEKVTRHSYGLRRRVGNAWEVEAKVIFRKDDTRESDFQFNLAVRSLLF